MRAARVTVVEPCVCVVSQGGFPPHCRGDLGGGEGGEWCPDTITTICSIGQSLGQRLNSTDPADSTKHLFGRLAVALWQVNAALWMHHQPTLSSFLDGLV